VARLKKEVVRQDYYKKLANLRFNRVLAEYRLFLREFMALIQPALHKREETVKSVQLSEVLVKMAK